MVVLAVALVVAIGLIIVLAQSVGAVPADALLVSALVLLVALYLTRRRATSWLEGSVDRVRLANGLVRLLLDGALLVIGMRLLYVENASGLVGGPVAPFLVYVGWGIGSDLTAQVLAKVSK